MIYTCDICNVSVDDHRVRVVHKPSKLEWMSVHTPNSHSKRNLWIASLFATKNIKDKIAEKQPLAIICRLCSRSLSAGHCIGFITNKVTKLKQML